MPETLIEPVLAAEAEAVTFAPTKVGFVSLGCPKNLVDSEVMMGILASSGAQLTSDAAEADVIVVNTCSFIESAKQESVNTILEMAQHKLSAGGKARKLVVAGCLVERYRNEIQKNIPEVDAVVGTGELESIVAAAEVIPRNPAGISATDSPFVILNGSAIQSSTSALQKATAGTLALNSRAEGDARESAGRFSRNSWDGAIADLPNYLMTEHTPRVLATGKYSAYLKIAEGCDHPCGFCIIPQLRGKFRSRRFESVIAEAERLAASGVLSEEAAEGASCKMSHSRGMPSRLQFSRTSRRRAFSVSRFSSGLMRRSTVNQHWSGTTLKLVPPPLCPPSIRMELRALSIFV